MNKYKAGSKIWLNIREWYRINESIVEKFNFTYIGPCLVKEYLSIMDEYDLIFPINVIINNIVYNSGDVIWISAELVNNNSELIEVKF